MVNTKRKTRKRYIELGLRLRQLRTSVRPKLTQAALGAKIDVKRSFISQVEHGWKRPSYPKLRELERFFDGTRPGDLFRLLGRPEFDWLPTLTSKGVADATFFNKASRTEREELRHYLNYLRFIGHK